MSEAAESKKKITEGIHAATIAGEARGLYERALRSPLATWPDIRSGAPIFVRTERINLLLAGMRRLEDEGKIPRDSPHFMRIMEDAYYEELPLRVKYGKTGISAAGWIRGKTKESKYDIHRVGTGFLVYKTEGGTDTTWLADRGLGKSDANLHYVALPRLEDGCHISSGVRIENNDEWPNYHFGATDINLLLNAVEVIIESLTAQEDVDKEDVSMPPITLIRDDVAAVGISRKRATTGELFNLECLGYLTRHFEIHTDWVFQFPHSVPTSIMDMTTRWFTKITKPKMVAEIHWPGYTEFTTLTGLIGRAERKKKKMPVLDYNPKRPQIVSQNLNMADVMMWVNYREQKLKDEGGLKQLPLFLEIRKYLKAVLEATTIDKGITRDEILKALSWIYVTAKRDKDWKVLKLTYHSMANLAWEWGISSGIIERTVGDIVEDRIRNPGRWVPLPKNAKQQEDIIKKIMPKIMGPDDDNPSV